MKRSRIIFLSAAAFIAVTFHSAAASDNRRTFTQIGVDPMKDSLEFVKMRTRLDSINRAKGRPTVALVLSGGGAKGAAHIGVMRRLEELGIPVDVVMGTSMGGLIGGMIAVGYNSSELDSIISSINWDIALSDKVPRSYISYTESKYKEKFTLSFPFFYSKEDYLDKKAHDEEIDNADDKYDDIHLGAENGDDASVLVRDNLIGSLPSGYVFGQNVNNIISSLTVGYQDPLNFDRLPVPFLCVATEMVTSKAKLWYDGSINTALRSTMSIPGLFAPVKTDGMVLVDGGMRDNYPVDIAKSMGADIIIGVDLNSGYKTYSGINNVFDIISQGIDMLGRTAYEYNSDLADVTIRPYLQGYDMLSFDPESIDTLINRGYVAAMAKDSLLRDVKRKVGGDTLTLQAPKAHNMNWEKVRISSIEITGVTDDESRYLMNLLSLDVNAPLSHTEIEDAVATIYGTKAFDYVTYEMEGSEEPFRLKFNCKKGPIHQFGVGLRADSDELVSAIVNVGLNVHRIQGSAFNMVGKVGSNPYLDLLYYYKSPVGPSINVSGLVKRVDRNQFNFADNDFSVNYLNVRNEVYLSNLNWKRFNLRGGVRNDYYKVFRVMAESVFGDYAKDNLKNDYVSLFFRAREDTFDDGYFPTKGVQVGFDYNWVIDGINDKIDNLHTIQFNVKWASSLGERFTLIPILDARAVVGKGATSQTRLPYMNFIGGEMRGRYIDQQMPFVGLNDTYPTMNWIGIARVDLRYKLLKNNYITAKANVGDAFAEIEDIFDTDKSKGMYGFGLEYAYDSIVGPLKFQFQWSNLSHRFGVYLSVGFDF